MTVVPSSKGLEHRNGFVCPGKLKAWQQKRQLVGLGDIQMDQAGVGVLEGGL